MDPIEIAICEDATGDGDAADRYLQEYLREKRYSQVQVRKYVGAFDLLGALDQHYIDIVLLDILLPGISGIEAARAIRKIQPQVKIVFLTSSPDYAVEAFSVQALHYVMKPLQKSIFFEAMDRAFVELRKVEKKQIVVKIGGGAAAKLDIEEIEYIKSYEHEQTIYLQHQEPLLAKQSLAFFGEILARLAPQQFVQPYKGYLINLKAVRVVQQEGIFLFSGEKIPIARNNFRALRDAYFNFSLSLGVTGAVFKPKRF